MRKTHPWLLAIISAALLLTTTAPAQKQDMREIEKGRWNTRSDYAKGWVVHHTRHYQVQSQAGIEKAKRLGEHMESMLRVYLKKVPPGKKFSKKRAIKLFRDRRSFLQYGAPPSAAAYYSPVDKEMVCYDTGKWLDEEDRKASVTGPKAGIDFRKLMARYKMDVLGVASHEGWHQYFHWYVVSWVELPSWINEGMGDYFYTAKPMVVKQGRRKKKITELGRMNHGRMAIVRSAVKQQRHVPIKQLLHYTKAQYYRNSSICYAQGWALCQFLQHSGNKRYARVIPKFLKLVKNDTNMEDVTKKSFRGVDLDQLEKDWTAWILSYKDPEAEAMKKARDERRKKLLERLKKLREKKDPAGEGAKEGGGSTDGQ